MQMNIEWKILMNSFKIPKIRFMNFNDKWKYIILGEISNSIEYGLNASAKDFDGIHKYLRITDIDDSSRLFLTDKLSSPDVNFSEEDYENYKLQKNDLLFARTGASVGKTYLYRESDGEVYYAGFLIRARLRDSFDGNFVFQQTLTDKYKQFIEITSQRSGQPGVNGKEYGEWKIGMTFYHEQSAIGSLFRTLDDLLASYKDNLANYQTLKANMLSKMFPKAGQTVPEIRLDGFEGEWESVKLGDNCRIITGGTPRTGVKEFWNPKEIPWMSSGEINKKMLNETEEMISYIGLENSSAKWVKQNSVLIALAGQGQTRGRVAINKIPLTTNQSIAAIETNDNIDFLFLYTDLSRRYDELRLISSGDGTRGGLNKTIISNLELNLPTLEEQQAIGTYFSNLDNLISAHQEKISQLETLKKKLLQDMFI